MQNYIILYYIIVYYIILYYIILYYIILYYIILYYIILYYIILYMLHKDHDKRSVFDPFTRDQIEIRSKIARTILDLITCKRGQID